MKFFVTLLVGLLLNLVEADVSHLAKHQQNTYVANDGRLVKQSFNANGGASFSASSQAYNGNKQNSNKHHWWMNTDESLQPHNHHTSQQVVAGCNRCAASSSTLNLKRQNTQSQHNNINGHYITRRPQNTLQINQIHNSHKTAPITGFQSQKLTQQSQSMPCTDSNSACVAPKFCYNGVIDQLVESKASRSTTGRCNAPEICCRFGQRRSANFKVIALDSVASPAQSTSEVLTSEGYVVRKPTNTYLPSFPDATNNDPVIVKPSTRPPPPPRPQPKPQPRPLIPQASEPVPRPFIPAPIVTPVGCSAAMNCTKIEMCTAMGVISKTPVILSPEQSLFRVPLTECLHPQTKEPGVCCRDPDYTDPWPVGRTGQYVPDELNAVFDSGKYQPETTNVDPVRIKPPMSDGYVIPQPSNTQNRLYLPPRNNQI
ncbi:hypothetical protein PVAND_014272 [Polypedilum vanderplanki]|uniref:Inactive serine protease scarface clip-domain domain-containing protein n=1 Tax=Polypedilum vanderplanki TaxID=319348 RepID=A0A9J6CT28_POLVA|nr:hypothetical protein PVAND_014272 [Polypedilum vanderplanki]